MNFNSCNFLFLTLSPINFCLILCFKSLSLFASAQFTKFPAPAAFLSVYQINTGSLNSSIAYLAILALLAPAFFPLAVNNAST
jgi:hypothetical protein